jgi:hypothetical protein
VAMSRHLLLRTVLASSVIAFLLSPSPARTAAPRFHDDDPLTREPASQDARDVKEVEIDLGADLLINLFAPPGDATPRRALNVNTVDEVPDSSWFTNRAYTRPISVDELLRGPNTMGGPVPGRWTVVAPKTAGMAPGFRVRDAAGEIWFITLDPAGAPVASTGAIAVACRLFWALGYHQIESYISSFRPEQLAIADTATIRTLSGRRRPLKMSDIELVLGRSARNADGSYRVLAARSVSGRPVGGFRYYGTRSDDPNDVIPHEHRRELRALKVFGAWVNLVDMKAGNTLDTVIEEGGRHVVRHYLQDVGSTFGTGALGPREWDEGYEYLYEGSPLWKRLVTLGAYLRPWQTAKYVDEPEIGRFEGDAFDPLAWRSRVPARAVLNAQDDDTFWAALRVSAFTDEMIRAVARTGNYTDPGAPTLLADVLIKRRDRILRAYLPRINPIVGCALGGAGSLTCDNAAVRAGAAPAPQGYRAEWFAFDNATGQATPIGTPTPSKTPQFDAPSALPTATDAYVKVSVAADDSSNAAWTRPVHWYFKRTGAAWKLVGLDRELPNR